MTTVTIDIDDTYCYDNAEVVNLSIRLQFRHRHLDRIIGVHAFCAQCVRTMLSRTPSLNQDSHVDLLKLCPFDEAQFLCTVFHIFVSSDRPQPHLEPMIRDDLLSDSDNNLLVESK